MNQRLRRSPPDHVYTPIDVTSTSGTNTNNLYDNSGVDFVDAGVQEGDWVLNVTTGATGVVTIVYSGQLYFADGLMGGTRDTWELDDEYEVLTLDVGADNVIDNNIVSGFDVGIVAYNLTDSSMTDSVRAGVTNNTVAETFAGIVVESDSPVPGEDFLHIEGNTVSDVVDIPEGLEVLVGTPTISTISVVSSTAILINNQTGDLIAGNDIGPGFRWGIYGYGLGGSLIGGDFGQVFRGAGNVITGAHHGIHLEHSYDNAIVGNSVTDNGQFAPGTFPLDAGGIHLVWSDGNRIAGNDLVGNGATSTGDSFGIGLDYSNDNRMGNNTTTGWGTGIRLGLPGTEPPPGPPEEELTTNDSGFNEIFFARTVGNGTGIAFYNGAHNFVTESEIRDNVGDGVLQDGGTGHDNHVNLSTITGNGGYGARNLSTGLLDVSANWWGISDDAVADEVWSNVTSSVATGGSDTTLEDDTADFVAAGVLPGYILVNETDGSRGVIAQPVVTSGTSWSSCCYYNDLYDTSGVNFQTLGVQPGDIVRNLTTGAEGVVTTVYTNRLYVSGGFSGGTRTYFSYSDSYEVVPGSGTIEATVLEIDGGLFGGDDNIVEAGDLYHIENIDFTPWLVDGTDTKPGKPGFQANRSELNVDADSPQWGDTTRVQEAVELISTQFIIVKAEGTHTADCCWYYELEDIQADFLAAGVQPGDKVTNLTTDATGIVTRVFRDGVEVDDGFSGGSRSYFTTGDEYEITGRTMYEPGTVLVYPGRYHEHIEIVDQGLEITAAGRRSDTILDGGGGDVVDIYLDGRTLDGDGYHVVLGRILFVASGTASATSDTSMTDSTTDFVAAGVQPGDTLLNVTDGSIARITDVVGDTLIPVFQSRQTAPSGSPA